MTISSTPTNFLEVSALVSLKVANKALFRGRKPSKSKFLGYFSKTEKKKCNHKILSLFDKFGMNMSSLDTYFLEVSAHALLKVVTKNLF